MLGSPEPRRSHSEPLPTWNDLSALEKGLVIGGVAVAGLITFPVLIAGAKIGAAATLIKGAVPGAAKQFGVEKAINWYRGRNDAESSPEEVKEDVCDSTDEQTDITEGQIGEIMPSCYGLEDLFKEDSEDTLFGINLDFDPEAREPDHP